MRNIFNWNNWKPLIHAILGIFTWNNWLRLIDAIPLLQPLASFSRDSHKRACIKWFVLVVAASAPVLLTVLLSPIPSGNLSLWQKMMKKLTESMSVSEQFVYCAAFLAPTLYLVWEKFLSVRDSHHPISENTSYKKLQNVMKVYRGYGWVLLVSIIILSTTALGFSFIKTANQTFSHTFLHDILDKYSSFIYAFALYAFYLSIVQDSGADGEYTSTFKKGEEDVTHGLGDRVNKGNQQ